MPLNLGSNPLHFKANQESPFHDENLDTLKGLMVPHFKNTSYQIKNENLFSMTWYYIHC